MKRIITGLALVTLAGAASAADLSIINPVTTGLNPSSANGGFNPSGGTISGFSATNGTIGTLFIDGPGTVTFTTLGKEAGYTNYFFDVGGMPVATLSAGSFGVISTQTYTSAGNLSFSFGTSNPSYGLTVSNGSAINGSPTFAIFSGGTSGYRYILGYDDVGAGPDRDFDDMVVGVNVSAVPEPETYAMMLAGLGLLGFAARRRKLKEAAAA